MNSMSRPYDHDACGCKKEKEDFKKKEECTKVLLKCGSPSSVPLPVIDLDILGLSPDILITSVAVDTSGFRNPCIKFEFSSNLVVTVATLALNLTFRIFKQCNNQTTPVGTPYTLAVPLGAAYATPVSFHICDCNVCPDECCTYTMVATSATSIILGGSINNAVLSALVVENDNKKNCNC